MTTLEELAEKHEEHEFSSGEATYTFTISQLRALIKEIVGEPVAYLTYKGHLLHADDPRVLEHSEPAPLHELTVD